MLVRAYVLQLKSPISNPEIWRRVRREEGEVQFTMLLLTAVLVGRVEEHHLDAYLATCKVIVES